MKVKVSVELIVIVSTTGTVEVVSRVTLLVFVTIEVVLSRVLLRLVTVWIVEDVWVTELVEVELTRMVLVNVMDVPVMVVLINVEALGPALLHTIGSRTEQLVVNRVVKG